MFRFILDLIYPKRCVSCGQLGTYLCPDCLTKVEFLQMQYCPGCKFVAKRGLTHLKCRSKTRLDGIQSLAIYEGGVRQLIQKIKYKGAFDILSEVLPTFLQRVFLEFEPGLTLIPVPLHSDRLQYRGFNQATLLTQKLANYFNEPYFLNYLSRKRNTVSQTHLSRQERLLNLKDAFLASNEVRGKSFLLVDDVWTTGATLNEAARELKKKGANKIYAFTMAMGK